ncbi:MAG: hypothetical protein U0271_15335 [Polyangiaceae bacterium]
MYEQVKVRYGSNLTLRVRSISSAQLDPRAIQRLVELGASSPNIKSANTNLGGEVGLVLVGLLVAGFSVWQLTVKFDRMFALLTLAGIALIALGGFLIGRRKRSPLPSFSLELPACFIVCDSAKGLKVYPWAAVQKITTVTGVNTPSHVLLTFDGGELAMPTGSELQYRQRIELAKMDLAGGPALARLDGTEWLSHP